MAEITEKMDDALWNSIRAFEEGEMFMRQMAEHLSEGHNGHTAETFLRRAEEAKRRSALMRQVAINGSESNKDSGNEA